MPRKPTLYNPKKAPKRRSAVPDVLEVPPSSSASSEHTEPADPVPDAAETSVSLPKRNRGNYAEDAPQVAAKMTAFAETITAEDARAAGSSRADPPRGPGFADDLGRPDSVSPTEDPQEEREVLLDAFLEADPLVITVPAVPDEELERNRLANMERARAAAVEENRLTEEAVERQRNRNNQIPTYLLAAVADDNVQQFTLGPFNQVSTTTTTTISGCITLIES